MEDVLIPQCIAIWWRDVEIKLFVVVCTDEGFGNTDTATHGGARGDREIGMIEE
jgi:hypothetical protein